MEIVFNSKEHLQTRRKLRKFMPPAEVMLWQKLKGRQLHGLKFRRQHSIGRYILDFYCCAIGLGIELDGDSHGNSDSQRRDMVREVYLKSVGIGVLRFQNSDVHNNLETVLNIIADYRQRCERILCNLRRCILADLPLPLLR